MSNLKVSSKETNEKGKNPSGGLSDEECKDSNEITKNKSEGNTKLPIKATTEGSSVKESLREGGASTTPLLDAVVPIDKSISLRDDNREEKPTNLKPSSSPLGDQNPQYAIDPKLNEVSLQKPALVDQPDKTSAIDSPTRQLKDGVAPSDAKTMESKEQRHISNELGNKLISSAAIPKSAAAQRVKIHFIPVGSAPQMKKRRFQLSGKEQFGTLQAKLHRMLQLTSSQLFLYINESFVPSPDDLIGDLDELFSSRGAKGELELKVNYSLQEAWG